MDSGNQSVTTSSPLPTMAFSEGGGWTWFIPSDSTTTTTATTPTSTTTNTSTTTGSTTPKAGDTSPSWASDGGRDRPWSFTPNEAPGVGVGGGGGGGGGESFPPPELTAPQMTSFDNSKDDDNNIGMNIFSSSLPDLFHSKPSVSDEKEDNELSLEELELRAIGNLLPDDDELLAEISNGVPGSSSSEEVDFFSNGGGLELDGDGGVGVTTGFTTITPGATEEQVSRTLFVRNINSNVEDDELRVVFERFGDVRTLYTGCKHEGLVLVSYFDLRAAKRAMRALHERLIWGCNLDMHYLIPKDEPTYVATHGVVAVYNVDPSVSNEELREIFGSYGDIREIHETPLKPGERYIEYYDARAADSALRALNRRDSSKRSTPRLNPSLFLPLSDDLEEDQYQQTSPPYLPAAGLAYPTSLVDSPLQTKYSSYTHPLSSLASSFSPHSSPVLGAKSSELGYPELDYGLLSHIRQQSSYRSREALEELALQRATSYEQRGIAGSRPGIVGAAPTSSSLPYSYSQLGNQSSAPLLWPPSAYLYGSKLHGLVNPVLGYPYGDKVRDRRRSLLRQAPGCMSFGSLRLGATGLGRSHDRKGDLSKTLGRFSSRHRGRRSGESNPTDKEQFHLDLEKIVSGEDKRTTLMLKNIPNKYTSKMLLGVIDEANQGTYDFIYLPIDFKNKCNVGYAFVNMIDPSYIISFHKAFNGKKWEKFNSEKVASVAYARIQGKAALVAHFQNSSLMNECRPIVFGDDGNTPDDHGKEIGIVMGASYEATGIIM